MIAALLHEDDPPNRLDRYSDHEAPTRPSIVPLTLLDELIDWDECDEPTDVIERRSGVIETPTQRNPELLADVIARELENIRRRGEE